MNTNPLIRFFFLSVLILLAFGIPDARTATADSLAQAGDRTSVPLLQGTISAGDFHTYGIKTDGTLTCWGDNASGQATPPGGSTFTQVSAGSY